MKEQLERWQWRDVATYGWPTPGEEITFYVPNKPNGTDEYVIPTKFERDKMDDIQNFLYAKSTDEKIFWRYLDLPRMGAQTRLIFPEC